MNKPHKKIIIQLDNSDKQHSMDIETVESEWTSSRITGNRATYKLNNYWKDETTYLQDAFHRNYVLFLNMSKMSS